MRQEGDLFDHLASLYGEETALDVLPVLEELVDKYKELIPSRGKDIAFDQTDSILITYADIVQNKGHTPLRTLNTFLKEYVLNLINAIHILPFFPYSSDDGFSITNYRKVNPEFGSWQDVGAISSHFQMMFDEVLNHISASSGWFLDFVNGVKMYQDYFITIEEDEDLSEVFRPRDLPLKTRVKTREGEKLVWTTFSADQIDLNYQNPQLLLEMIDILLFYVSKGADYIRMDAVAYIWKERGTNCIHMPQVHEIVQIFRQILDAAAPWVKMITETNVPHNENISYFGDGANEAQLVYNFSLPPLVLHAFHSGSARTLTEWAGSLEYPSDKTTFFNFLASHDGIGVMPVRGILKGRDVEAMANRVKRLNGSVSYKDNADGTKSPYELNINYLDALCDPDHPNEPDTLIAKRFLASQAIMLAMKGVPGIYFHSLFGSRNWIDGVKRTGRARTINREKLKVENISNSLDNVGSLRNLVFTGYKNLLEKRRSNPAFHPSGKQKVLKLHDCVFSVLRSSPNSKHSIICLQSTCDIQLEISLNPAILGSPEIKEMKDLLSRKVFSAENGRFNIQVEPYAVLWLIVPV